MVLNGTCWRKIGLRICICCTLLISGNGFADDVAAGKIVYEGYCAACHGFDGIPIMPDTPNFAKAEKMEASDEELLNSIVNGKGDVMPPWLGILTEEQCAQVLAYIREMPE